MSDDKRKWEPFDYMVMLERLQGMGYIPPACRSWRIESRGAFGRPTITMVADAGKDLAQWIGENSTFDRRIEIIHRYAEEPRPEPERIVIGGDGHLEGLRACNVFGWVATVLAVCGVLLNNFQLWPCFLFWILSNGISAWIHRAMGPRSLMVRDIVFLILAVVGLWQWVR